MKRNDCEHQEARCQMPRGHGDDVKCRFVCDDCSEEFVSDDRCIREIVLSMDISMPASAGEFNPSVAVSKGASQLVGEIIMEYALAEHTLRETLKQLPKHRDRSFMSEDLKRLEKWLPEILEQSTGGEWKTAFDKCVKELRSAFDAVQPKRHTLAHGQLHVHVSETTKIGVSGEEDSPSEPGEGWYTMRRLHQDEAPQQVEVVLSESELSKVLTEAIELRNQVGVLQKLAGFQRTD